MRPAPRRLESAGRSTRGSTSPRSGRVHKDIDDQIRANADSNWRLDSDATTFVTNQLLLRRDLDWNDTFFKTGQWGTDLTGVTGTVGAGQFLQWSDPNSDPIVQFADLQTNFVEQSGRKANTLVLGARAITQLKNHPDIIDRIKYTQRGVVTTDLLASLFDVEKILVSYATVTDVAELNDAKAQDAAATYRFMSNSKSALLGYTPQLAVPDDPGRVATPSPGTGTWLATATGSG